MIDKALAGMATFYERYDRRTRRLMLTALAVTLALSAATAVRMLAIGGLSPKSDAMIWWFGVVFTPLLTLAWWTFTELMARGRRKASPPDWRIPTTEDDARNARRIANAGLVFTVGLTVAAIANQALNALPVFGSPIGFSGGEWIARATMIVVGGVTVYLGNLWPRMPAPRAPERKPAAQMKAHRLTGWFMVIVGLAIILLGLFLPLLQR